MRGGARSPYLCFHSLILSLVTWLTFLAIGGYPPTNHYSSQSTQIVAKVIFSAGGFQTIMVALPHLRPSASRKAITSECE